MTTDRNAIREGMAIIGADGTHVGTVDGIDSKGDRIKMTRKDSADGRHHYLPMELVADIEGDNVRLSSTATNTLFFED